MSQTNTSRHREKWTQREDDELRMNWGLHSIKALAKRLGRSEKSVYKRAGILDLGLGCPQGFERLTNAASRTNYCLESLRRILHWARVPMRKLASFPGSKGLGAYVEPCAVDAAIAKWCRMETGHDAARRTGVLATEIVRWYEADEKAGLIPTRPPRGKGTPHRLDPAHVDRVIARRREGETGQQAACRVGVHWETLRRMLLEAGIQRPATKGWRLDPLVVDDVVRQRRSTESMEEAARRVGVRPDTLGRWMRAAGFDRVQGFWRVKMTDVDRVVAERTPAYHRYCARRVANDAQVPLPLDESESFGHSTMPVRTRTRARSKRTHVQSQLGMRMTAAPTKNVA